MALTAKEAFKIGFLHTCKEAGLSQQQVSDLLEKQAFLNIPAAAAGLAGFGAPTLLAAGIGIPAAGYLGGRAVGNALASGTDATPDSEDLKAEERVNKYRQLAEQIRTKMKSKQRMQR